MAEVRGALPTLEARHTALLTDAAAKDAEIARLREVVADARRAALEEAARICEEERRGFLSPEYATGQPMSSFGERFACGQCMAAIRRAAAVPQAEEEACDE